MEGPTILLTGLPRSGTTLACELLGSVPNTIALDEPMGPADLTGVARRDASVGPLARVTARLVRRGTAASGGAVAGQGSMEAVADRVAQFAAEMRLSALTRGKVRTTSVDGQVIGARVSDERDRDGVRRPLSVVSEIAVGRPMTDDFTLAIKQCGSFTASLGALTPRFPVFALVRNPLSLLLSWQSVPMPIRDGHLPVAESLDPRLARSLAAIDGRFDRQFCILEWFFDAFARFLPPTSVIRYEDVVATSGRALAVVVPGAASLERRLTDRNRDRPVGEDHAILENLARRLLGTDGPWWQYYARDSVADLLSSIT